MQNRRVETVECIEDVILRNAGARGIDRLRRFLPSDFCWRAAGAILEILKRQVSPVALITTGFFVGDSPETDGPPGAYFLHQALKRLGFYPKIITDSLCLPLFSKTVPDEELIVVPMDIDNEEAFAREIFETHTPGLLISVERCGRTREGTYRDMRGNDITSQTAPIDALFLRRPEGCVTIGIGDGGNEIGMGHLAEEISRTLPIAPCVVSVDHLILATVSNWGACGLIRCLEVLAGTSCAPESDEVVAFLSLIVSRGAVDGISKQRELKVDGYDLTQIGAVIRDLKHCSGKEFRQG